MSLEGKCDYNEHVEAMHTSLRAKGIEFPCAMDPDTDKEIASWSKSLFLSGKKGKEKFFFILTTRSTVKANLKEVAKAVGVKELRMAGAADMEKLLHITAGCVTALSALLDDAKARYSPSPVALLACLLACLLILTPPSASDRPPPAVPPSSSPP